MLRKHKGSGKKLLMIGLDGFEILLAERLMASGRMPHLANLRERSARFRLDHGLAKYTGLAWEHFSTGQKPELLNHHSAITFDPNSYNVRQDPTRYPPIFGCLESNCVLFDVPYCDLQLEPRLKGVARWGAHDPGVPASCNPGTLAEEISARFGSYPATDYIYAVVWQSPEETRKAGEALVNAVRTRTLVAEWLLKERLTSWDLGVVVVSETHSATEPLWHGVNPSHPLHELPSAPIARRGLEAVYIETDRLVGHLVAAFPDACVMAFAMHGMGDNEADIPAMVLLPELLYRRQFGGSYLRELPWSSTLPNGTPILAEDESWYSAMEARIPPLWSESVQSVVAARMGRRDVPIVCQEIDWQPAARYRPFWPDMEAFAMPSFYDGRIRVNLIGRERYGAVSPGQHHNVISEIKSLLEECVDPLTSVPVVAHFHEPCEQPLDRHPSQSDLCVFWRGLPCGLHHPKYGWLGPIPYRRTGGHSGPRGFLYCAGPEFPANDYGDTSSFDVIPTALSILGEEISGQAISGRSLVHCFD